MISFAAAAAALSLISTVYGQSLAKTCPESDICFQLNIPETTASSGTGDIFFQLKAPTSYQWVSLGQGSKMSGSNIFVMYASADGTNVTLSPRLGTGHVEPQHDIDAQITLLDGTGVSDGMMTANVKCSNCDAWSGGSMDFSSDSSQWIHAYKKGEALNTDDLEASISQHDVASPFSWSIASAKGGDSLNPFVASSGSSGSASGSGSTSLPPCTGSAAATATLASLTATASESGADVTGCPTAYPTEFSSAWPTARPTWASSCFPSGYGSWPTDAPWRQGGGGNDNDKREETQACVNADGSISNPQSGDGSSSSSGASFENNGVPFGGDYQKANNIILAHGVLASLAFVALFPTGGILIRIASFTGLIWVHAACQLLGYLIYIVALGLGIYYATQMNLIGNSHPIIGIVLFIILLLQPVSGLLHHRLFKKYGSRTAWSYEHLSIGRIAIVLGIINGGLGIRLAGDVSRGGKIAYAVIAAIMGLLYIAAVIVGERRRSRHAPPSYEKSQKATSPGSPHGTPALYSETGNVREHYGK